MKNALVFDMDGTIADLYGVKNWLSMLRNSDPTPYAIASPLVDMDIFNNLINEFHNIGWAVYIVSWLSKGSSRKYEKEVMEAKKGWLSKMGIQYDKAFFVSYGTNKSKVTKRFGGYQILVDDEEKNRNEWNNGETIDANKDIIAEMMEILARA